MVILEKDLVKIKLDKEFIQYMNEYIDMIIKTINIKQVNGITVTINSFIELLNAFVDIFNDSNNQFVGMGMPVNPYLWKASLETFEFMSFAPVFDHFKFCYWCHLPYLRAPGKDAQNFH